MLVILSEFNDRLRSEIDRIGISQLSRDLGSARNTIYNWCEKGNIPLDKLIQLGKIGVDIGYVVLGTKEVTSLNNEESVLVSKYRESDPNIKNKILMLLLMGENASNSVAHTQNNNVKGQQIGNNNEQNNHYGTKQKTSIKVKDLYGEITGIKNE